MWILQKIARRLAYRLMKFGTGGWVMEFDKECACCTYHVKKDIDLLDCMNQLH